MSEENKIYHISFVIVSAIHFIFLYYIGQMYSFDYNKIVKPIKLGYVIIKKATEIKEEKMKVVEKTNVPVVKKENKQTETEIKDNRIGLIKRENPVKNIVKNVKSETRKKEKYDPVASLLANIKVDKYLKADKKVNKTSDFTRKKDIEKTELKRELNLPDQDSFAYSKEDIIRKKVSEEIKPGNREVIASDKYSNKTDNIEDKKLDLVFKHEVIKFDSNRPILIKSDDASIEKVKPKTYSDPKLLKSPNIPAPEWFERKGITTEILLKGIIDSSGFLDEVDIIKTSGYYKLDIMAKRFLKENWRWESGKDKAEVRIRLYVELKD